MDGIGYLWLWVGGEKHTSSGKFEKMSVQKQAKNCIQKISRENKKFLFLSQKFKKASPQTLISLQSESILQPIESFQSMLEICIVFQPQSVLAGLFCPDHSIVPSVALRGATTTSPLKLFSSHCCLLVSPFKLISSHHQPVVSPLKLFSSHHYLLLNPLKLFTSHYHLETN